MNVITPVLDTETRKALFYADAPQLSVVDVAAGTVKEAHKILAEKAAASVAIHVETCVAKYRIAMAHHWKALASEEPANEKPELPKPGAGMLRDVTLITAFSPVRKLRSVRTARCFFLSVRIRAWAALR